MNVTVKINCDNAAFTDAPDLEVARILRELANAITGEDLKGYRKTVLDINGNSVGELKVTR